MSDFAQPPDTPTDASWVHRHVHVTPLRLLATCHHLDIKLACDYYFYAAFHTRSHFDELVVFLSCSFQAGSADNITDQSIILFGRRLTNKCWWDHHWPVVSLPRSGHGQIHYLYSNQFVDICIFFAVLYRKDVQINHLSKWKHINNILLGHRMVNLAKLVCFVMDTTSKSTCRRILLENNLSKP